MKESWDGHKGQIQDLARIRGKARTGVSPIYVVRGGCAYVFPSSATARALLTLGFKNLGLGPQKFNDFLRAFSGTGVAVPNTNWRLRFAYPYAVVEPADGSEQETLPDWWKEAVLVTDDQFLPTWVGKRVRPDQSAGFNLQAYRDAGEGLVPP